MNSTDFVLASCSSAKNFLRFTLRELFAHGRRCGHTFVMTTTLEEIHRDPGILDRAIAHRESLDIVADGEVTATLVPKARVPEPDFVARAKRIWGEVPPGKPLSELVSDSRD